MKAIAINGSPRKKWNTATLLEKALEGAAAEGAETELVHLYDLDYKGCVSCFACKTLGGKSYGKCVVRDDITPVLERVAEADVLLVGSPIYMHSETGETRSFLERLVFPYITYTPGYKTIFMRRIPTGLVYTMNISEEALVGHSQMTAIESTRGYMTRLFGSCELLLCTDTYQFEDYSKVLSTAWDPVAKVKRREEVFPQDCARATAMGAKLVRDAKPL